MNVTRANKTNLGFGWVNVDVDIFRRKMYIQHADRVSTSRKQFAIGGLNAMEDDLVVDGTTIDKGMQRGAIASRGAR